MPALPSWSGGQPGRLRDQVGNKNKAMLTEAARSVGEDWSDQCAALPEHWLAAEVALESRKRKAEEEARQLTKLQAKAVYSKPTEWRGKKYHRRESPLDENARIAAFLGD